MKMELDVAQEVRERLVSRLANGWVFIIADPHWIEILEQELYLGENGWDFEMICGFSPTQGFTRIAIAKKSERLAEYVLQGSKPSTWDEQWKDVIAIVATSEEPIGGIRTWHMETKLLAENATLESITDLVMKYGSVHESSKLRGEGKVGG